MKTTFQAERAAREEHAALGLDYVQAEGDENLEPQANTPERDDHQETTAE